MRKNKRALHEAVYTKTTDLYVQQSLRKFNQVSGTRSAETPVALSEMGARFHKSLCFSCLHDWLQIFVTAVRLHRAEIITGPSIKL